MRLLCDIHPPPLYDDRIFTQRNLLSSISSVTLRLLEFSQHACTVFRQINHIKNIYRNNIGKYFPILKKCQPVPARTRPFPKKCYLQALFLLQAEGCNRLFRCCTWNTLALLAEYLFSGIGKSHQCTIPHCDSIRIIHMESSRLKPYFSENAGPI